MYIVIVGSGRVGFQLAKALVAVGHEVTAIEKDPVRHRYIANEIGSVAIRGDGSSLNTLEAGGCSRADMVIAVTDTDEVNLTVCQMAKAVFNTPRTIALVKNLSHNSLFRVLGVDTAVNTTHLALSTLEAAVPNQSLIHLLDLQRHSMNVVAVSIPPDAAVVGKPLSQVEVPPSSFITLVVKDEGPLLPQNNLVLSAGDQVVVATVPDEEQDLLETLTGVE